MERRWDAALDALPPPHRAPPQPPTAVALPHEAAWCCRRFGASRIPMVVGLKLSGGGSACHGPTAQTVICRRWPIPGEVKNPAPLIRARPDDPNRNSWPSTSPTAPLRLMWTRDVRSPQRRSSVVGWRFAPDWTTPSPVGPHGVLQETHQPPKGHPAPNRFSLFVVRLAPRSIAKNGAKGEDRPVTRVVSTTAERGQGRIRNFRRCDKFTHKGP